MKNMTFMLSLEGINDFETRPGEGSPLKVTRERLSFNDRMVKRAQSATIICRPGSYNYHKLLTHSGW